MKLRQRIFLLIALISLFLDLVYIVVQRVLAPENGIHGDIFHTVLVLTMLLAGGTYIFRLFTSEERQAVQLIGRTVMAITIYLLIIGIAQLSAMTHFLTTAGRVAPTSFSTLVTTVILASAGGLTGTIVFASLTRLIFIKRRKNTKRNYVILLVVCGILIVLDFIILPNGLGMERFGTLRDVVFVLVLIGMVINAFRFSWILVLSRREKIINLLLSFFGFLFFLILTIYAAGNEALNNSLLYFHPIVQTFVALCFQFGAIYMGIGFTSTLLHLPTAKEFDRKKVEISSLQNMSRLITQVFDFDELVATTTHLALEVSEGDASWLELVPTNGKTRRNATEARSGIPETTILRNSLKNIDPEAIGLLKTPEGQPLQHLVFETGKPILIQDFQGDRRISPAARKLKNVGTLVVAPLSSHGEIIGLLCVTKHQAFEFDKDTINVLSAFADMVSVALENSALIRESIEKERMEQELKVAQQMQRSLLPHILPSSPRFEIAAQSVPAYEVGGDYYDVLNLDPDRLGFVVGDVSGKGVSAALYMAQVKGIFQSLSNDSASTREILIRMNGPLCNSMEKKSFISLLYAVLDTSNGQLSFSRAGHCPLLYVHDGNPVYLRPEGMALGLDPSDRFASSLEEKTLQLTAGDIVVVYTDGVTESRDSEDREFEYDRLAACVLKHHDSPATMILDSILDEVQAYSGKDEAEDDITVLVLRWKDDI
jgi:sigma-B regulation protein RsbU (phosphoserine phosphatase)